MTRGAKLCMTCGLPGHTSANCPQAGAILDARRPPKYKTCETCNGTGEVDANYYGFWVAMKVKCPTCKGTGRLEVIDGQGE